MNEKTSAVYLIPQEGSKWSASLSDVPPARSAIHLVDVQSFPAELFYSRIDSNGSLCYEKETIANKEDLVESLNWLGNCRWTPLSIWDFNLENTQNEALVTLFDEAAQKRMEIIEAEMDAMYGGSKESPNHSPAPAGEGAKAKPSLANQIQSATSRKGETAPTTSQQEKAPEPTR